MSLTSLLEQADVDHSGRTETLNDTLRKCARDLQSDAALAVVVAALREQRTRWNAAQASGSKERISSKKITVPKAAAVPNKFKLKIPPKPVI